MFTDIVGYTALTQSDEGEALQILDRHNKLIRPFFGKYHGREVKTIGDSFLVEFESALDATVCAVEIQKFLLTYNSSSADRWKIKLRIGIHVGDVVKKNGDIFGDAVNIASRIQPLAEPGGICVSQQIYDQVHNKIGYPLLLLEVHELKNVAFRTDVYAVDYLQEKQQASEHSRVQTREDRKRIAVLPFANMSPDPQDAYFADGITEEIITALSGISAFSVISRTSVMAYKGTNKRLKEIGRELEVGSIVEGSFRKAGNRVRITAQLIEVSSDNHIWASSYNRELDDIFAIQSEIASRVSEMLKIKLLDSDKQQIAKIPTRSMDAFENYLRWIYADNLGLDWNQAAVFLEEAIRRDPNFALAYAMLGDTYVAWGGESIPWKEAVQKASPLIEKALQLDDNSSEAHAANGNLAMQNRLDFDLASKEFRRAIELNPSNSRAILWSSLMHYTTGEIEEAISEAGIASRLDPMSFGIHINFVDYLRTKRDYSTARDMWSKFTRLNPSNTLYRIVLANLVALAGNKQEAAKELDWVLENHPQSLPWERIQLAQTLYNIGRIEDSETQLAQIESETETKFYPTGRLAEVYALLGRRREAINLLKSGFEAHPFSFLMARQLPAFDSLREDPNFKAIIDIVHKNTLNFQFRA